LAHALRDHGAHEVFGLPGEHSRPVYLEVPRDLVNTPCAPVQRLPPTPWAPAAAAACAEDIMARLNSAERAVILVDVEVRRFGLEAQVAELAHRLGLPCATTFLGAGLMADHRDLMHGTYLGAAGDSAVTALIEDADVVLGLGLIPSDTNLGIATSSFDWRRVIDVAERRVSIGYCVYENVPLAAVVEGLLAVTKRTHNAPRATPRPIAPPIGPPAEPVAPVRPSDIIAAVESLRSHHPLPITVDVGDCLFAAVDLAPGPLIAAGYYAAMGMASPAALARDPGQHRPTRPRAGRRRGLSHDRLRAHRRHALRLGPNRHRLQQRRVDDAAHLRGGLAHLLATRRRLRRARSQHGRRRLRRHAR